MSDTPRLIKAKPVLEKLKSDVASKVAAFEKEWGRKPRLAVVLVGEDPASVIYTSKKGKVAVELGMEHATLKFPAEASPSEVREAVLRLNEDPKVDGILIQRPLPAAFPEHEILYWVAPEKDVDAFHPETVGRLQLGLTCFQPCTPSGVMELLRHYEVDVAGKEVCVIGRSAIVGKPMAALLLQAHATVTQCHSRTKNLPEVTRRAEVLVVAAGKPGLIGREHIRPGAVVIDVGIHRKPEGGLCGDVRFEEACEVASAITPVPGGVGPMTIGVLMRNTLLAAEQRQTQI